MAKKRHKTQAEKTSTIVEGKIEKVIYRRQEVQIKPHIRCAGCILNIEGANDCKWDQMFPEGPSCLDTIKQHVDASGDQKKVYCNYGWDYKWAAHLVHSSKDENRVWED